MTTTDRDPDFALQFARIQSVLGVHRQVDIAQALGVSAAWVAGVWRRGKIPCKWLLKLFRLYKINPEWILTGKGPCRVSEPEPFRRYTGEEEILRLEAWLRHIPSRMLADELVRRSETSPDLSPHSFL